MVAAEQGESADGEAGVDFGSGVVAAVVVAGLVGIVMVAMSVGEGAGSKRERKGKEGVFQEFSHVVFSFGRCLQRLNGLRPIRPLARWPEDA